jgi:hypothetical protein
MAHDWKGTIMTIRAVVSLFVAVALLAVASPALAASVEYVILNFGKDGTVEAREAATGKTAKFTIRDQKVKSGLSAGQKIYVDPQTSKFALRPGETPSHGILIGAQFEKGGGKGIDKAGAQFEKGKGKDVDKAGAQFEKGGKGIDKAGAQFEKGGKDIDKAGAQFEKGGIDKGVDKGAMAPGQAGGMQGGGMQGGAPRPPVR